MASKKEWKRRFRVERDASDSLLSQLTAADQQLQRVDEILATATLEGPTIDAWAQQVRDLLRALVTERGIVSGGVASQVIDLDPRPTLGAFIERHAAFAEAPPRDHVIERSPVTPEHDVVDGEYSL